MTTSIFKDTKTIYTDLANEAFSRENSADMLPGVTRKVLEIKSAPQNIGVEIIEISDAASGEKLGKGCGRYVSIRSEYALNRDKAHHKHLAAVLCQRIKELLPEKRRLTMVVGLGNRAMTPDALGPRTADRIMVTRHFKQLFPGMTDKRLSAVCAFQPSVLGTTGIESADAVSAMCDKVHPDCVIAVDSLAAAEPQRINDTIQLSDAGIAPGAGVGNRRRGIDSRSLGVPVLAIGIPVVVRLPLQKQDGEEEMIVTAKNIDAIINDCSAIIAGGINLALHDGVTEEEIADFMY